MRHYIDGLARRLQQMDRRIDAHLRNETRLPEMTSSARFGHPRDVLGR
jgi:hypothetical protein